MEIIKVRGAKTHNLKNIDIDIKLNSLTVLSGPSGSGKTSLAFHTLLTESKRRFLNSFPTDVKFFWDIPQTADVDSIFPVLPVWGLSQHNPVVGSRPAVIDHLDLAEKIEKIFHLIGHATCPQHRIPFEKVSPSENLMSLMIDQGLEASDHIHVLVDKKKFKEKFGVDFFPARSFSHEGLRGFNENDEYWEILKFKFVGDSKRISNQLTKIEMFFDSEWLVYCPQKSKSFSFYPQIVEKCPKCEQYSNRRNLYAHSLSPYNPMGACPKCQGHGMLLEYDQDKIVKDQSLSIEEGAVHLVNYSRFVHYLPALINFFKKEGLDTKAPFNKLPAKKWKLLFEGGGRFPGVNDLLAYLEARKYKKNVRIYLRGLQKEVLCPSCEGVRVCSEAQLRLVKIANFEVFYKDLLLSSLSELRQTILKLEKALLGINHERMINLDKTLKTVKAILDSCCKMNLGYLKLSQKVRTLSAGVYQRLLLIKFTSFEGSGSLLILDEPSLGLNVAEQDILMTELEKVKKQGNTILLIDHSSYIHSRSDQYIEMGPGAGHLGGEIVYQGKYKKKKKPVVPQRESRPKNKVYVTISGLVAPGLSLKNIKFLKYGLNAVSGSSDSNKEGLCLTVIPNIIPVRKMNEVVDGVQFNKIEGADDISHCIVFDGSIGRTSSRSTLGTMLELTPQIRKYYANLEFSKSFNLEKGHFSPNSELGKCLTCEGRGVISHDMQFLEDVVFTCDDCKGMKLRPFYAQISDGRFTYHQAVSSPMSEVLDFIPLTSKYKRIWEFIKILKLDYLSLDRSFSSLSGGERLRVKLLAELTKTIRDSLLVFENLSFGLSEAEITKLCDFLGKLCEDSNTVILLDESPELLARAHNVLKL